MARTRRWTVALALLCAFAACRGTPETPEAQVRAWIARAEQAAENKNDAAVDDLVSARYRDEHGFNRQNLHAMLLRIFLAHRTIHVWTQINSIAFPAADRADVIVFAALAAGPIASLQDLATLHADIYRFDIELSAESPGAWQLTRADWRPAELEDLE